jgi:hypothetical protein
MGVPFPDYSGLFESEKAAKYPPILIFGIFLYIYMQRAILVNDQFLVVHCFTGKKGHRP